MHKEAAEITAEQDERKRSFYDIKPMSVPASEIKTEITEYEVPPPLPPSGISVKIRRMNRKRACTWKEQKYETDEKDGRTRGRLDRYTR